MKPHIERVVIMEQTILVVDDEREIADLVEVYLKNEGFPVLKAYTAAEALEIIAQKELSLAILDVMLPDMDLPSAKKFESPICIPF